MHAQDMDSIHWIFPFTPQLVEKSKRHNDPTEATKTSQKSAQDHTANLKKKIAPFYSNFDIVLQVFNMQASIGSAFSTPCCLSFLEEWKAPCFVLVSYIEEKAQV